MIREQGRYRLRSGEEVPVLAPAKYSGIQIAPDYWLDLRLYSRSIVLVHPRGESSMAAINAVWNWRNHFIEEFIGKGQPFLEIKDYSGVIGLPPAGLRKRQTELFESDTGHSLAFHYFGGSLAVRAIMRTGLLLKQAPYPFVPASGLDDALEKALERERQYLSEARTALLAISGSPFAMHRGQQGWLRLYLLRPNLAYFRATGWFTEVDLASGTAMLDRLDRNSSNGIHLVVDLNSFEGMEPSMKEDLSLALQRRIHSNRNGLRSMVVIGPQERVDPLCTSLGIQSQESFCSTARDLEFATAWCLNSADTSPSSAKEGGQVPRKAMLVQPEQMQALLLNIGRLCWDEGNRPLDETAVDDPLAPAYQALELVRQDIASLLESRRNAEAALASGNDELRATLQSRTEFVSSLSHGLRTPLHGLLGMLDLLETATTEAERTEYLKDAKTSAQEILGLLQSTFELSSLVSGKIDLVPTDISTHDFFHGLADEFTQRCREKGLRFEFLGKSSMPEQIRTDGRLLQKILSILLGNSLKTTATGKIQLGTSYHAKENTPGLIECTVEDTGIGMDDGMQHHMLAPLMGFDARYSNPFLVPGGMDLPIATMLVKRMGGSMEVSSILGKGSRYRFRLPLSD